MEKNCSSETMSPVAYVSNNACNAERFFRNNAAASFDMPDTGCAAKTSMTMTTGEVGQSREHRLSSRQPMQEQQQQQQQEEQQADKAVAEVVAVGEEKN